MVDATEGARTADLEGIPSTPSIQAALAELKPEEFFENLMLLQRSLEPVVGALSTVQMPALLKKLEDENEQLRKRLLELEGGVRSPLAVNAYNKTRLAPPELQASFAPSCSASLQSIQDLSSPRDGSAPSSQMRAPPMSPSLKSYNSDTSRSMLGHRNSVKSKASSASSPEPMVTGAPPRAFVINVRRLIDTEETFNLLHCLITSTAIAAMTLVNAGTRRQFCSTLVFLFITIVFYIRHMKRHDMIDISDLRQMLPLLADDETGAISNPNRLLKALSFDETHIWEWLGSLLLLCIGVILFIQILICQRFMEETDAITAGMVLNHTDFIGTMRPWFILSDDDGMVMGMQVFVAVIMCSLHIIFETIFHYECNSVMPRNANGEVLDPRRDPLPLRYRVFGLPSMWFTSSEVHEDLKLWIHCATPSSRAAVIHPQEIAYYALTGNDEREDIQLSLKDSKLFDGNTREFINRDGALAEGQPVPLNIELRFFESAVRNKECPFPGEFLCFDSSGLDESSPQHATKSAARTHHMSIAHTSIDAEQLPAAVA